MTGRIVYSCPFVPAEWIAAHGMTPARVMSCSVTGSPSVEIAPGMCPYIHAFINTVVSSTTADAVVITTACDQMRRASELIADRGLPVFLMNVPTTWQTPSVQKLYIAELERLGRFMARLGGEPPPPDRLREVMLEYDTARSAVKAGRGFMSAREYSELIADFHGDKVGIRPVWAEIAVDGALSPPRGVPLALVGGPMLRDHLPVLGLVEQAGAYFALDATETGERTLPAPLDRRKIGDDPMMALADMYFGSIPDAFRRPNSELYRWLGHEIGERGIRGVVLRRYVWCDTWHAEVQRIREWAGLPLLDLDVSDDPNEIERMKSRLQAFVEVLK